MPAIEYMTFEKFYKKNKSRLNQFAFLFGNGFPKSSPEFRGLQYFDISHAEYKTICRAVYRRIKTLIITKQSDDENNICPEELLNCIRLIYGIEIFKKYQEKQSDLVNQNISRPTKFLGKFKSVYTLNYDLYSYVCQFENGDKECRFTDGFSNKPLTLHEIQSRQDENIKEHKIPFYYLHGAFHIFQKDCCGKYEKIVSAGDYDGYANKVLQKYLQIDSALNTYEFGKVDFKGLDDPIIVFSSGSLYKGASVIEDLYLTNCLDNLCQERLVFTFGCSFKNDQFLFEKILSPIGCYDKEIYLGYYNEKDKKNIEMMLSKISKKHEKFLQKTTLVDISEKQQRYIDKYIWNKRNWFLISR